MGTVALHRAVLGSIPVKACPSYSLPFPTCFRPKWSGSCFVRCARGKSSIALRLGRVAACHVSSTQPTESRSEWGGVGCVFMAVLSPSHALTISSECRNSLGFGSCGVWGRDTASDPMPCISLTPRGYPFHTPCADREHGHCFSRTCSSGNETGAFPSRVAAALDRRLGQNWGRSSTVQRPGPRALGSPELPVVLLPFLPLSPSLVTATNPGACFAWPWSFQYMLFHSPAVQSTCSSSPWVSAGLCAGHLETMNVTAVNCIFSLNI